MKFFVPEVETSRDAENLWEATRKFAGETLEWVISDRRIYEIRYCYDNKPVIATVGKPDPTTGEQIMVILEAESVLVCTANRGVIRGMCRSSPVVQTNHRVRVAGNAPGSEAPRLPREGSACDPQRAPRKGYLNSASLRSFEGWAAKSSTSPRGCRSPSDPSRRSRMPL